MTSLNTYCNMQVNYFKPECNCINPPQSVLNVAGNMLMPYYCWYEPCFQSNVYKTPEIITGQQTCNSTNCLININQIKTIGGTIYISNICASNFMNLGRISLDLIPFDFEFKLPLLFKLSTSFIVLILGLFIYVIV